MLPAQETLYSYRNIVKMRNSSVTRGNSLRQEAFRPAKPNWRESRTRKTTELKLFARARELANSDLLMEVIDGGNCNSVERLARCWHSLLLPEVQGLISTSQGTEVGQELRLLSKDNIEISDVTLPSFN